MAAISQTTFWVLLMKERFCILILDNRLAPNKRQAITWTNADRFHWRMYAALGGDELTRP